MDKGFRYEHHFIIIILVILFIIRISLGGLVISVAYGLSKKRHWDYEKLRPFECGFSPQINRRTPFSIQFFLISLIFLIFDIEIILIFPYIIKVFIFKEISSFLTIWIFLVILSIGLFIEWSEKILEWYKFK